LRKGSSYFGKYFSTILSEENKRLLYLPRGFGHAFATLENNTEMIYKVDNGYSLENEGGIIWNDPFLNIKWPFNNPILSERDKKWGSLEEFLVSSK